MLKEPNLADFVHPSPEFPDPIQSVLADMLGSVRRHLHMDVGFISEFIDRRRVFRYVDSALPDAIIKPGDSGPLEDSYCQHVVDGRLPELIPDTALCPAAVALPVTAAVPVGAHLSVPIRLENGHVYGTFCFFSHTPDPTLNERDLAMMRVFAELAAKQIDQELVSLKRNREMENRIDALLSQNQLSMVYQPIYHLIQKRITSFESLARFSASPLRTPDAWFREAAMEGFGPQLELQAIELALQAFRYLPEDMHLSLNLSPETILKGRFQALLEGLPIHRIVLEITEHAAIDSYDLFLAALRPLRDRGLRIAIDDAGAGYASFRHILNLAPDLIKLDISLTQRINIDKPRRALAAALIRFAEKTGSSIIAEGIETAAEFNTLAELGIDKAQGYFIGHPMPLNATLDLCARQGHATALAHLP